MHHNGRGINAEDDAGAVTQPLLAPAIANAAISRNVSTRGGDIEQLNYASIYNHEPTLKKENETLPLFHIICILSTAFAYGCIMTTLFIITLPLECERINQTHANIDKSVALGVFVAIAGWTQLISPLVGRLSDTYIPPMSEVSMLAEGNHNMHKSTIDESTRGTVKQLVLGQRLPYLVLGSMATCIGLLGQAFASHYGFWIRYSAAFFIHMLGLNIVYSMMVTLIPDQIAPIQTGIANGVLALLLVTGSLFGFALFYWLVQEKQWGVQSMYEVYIAIVIVASILTGTHAHQKDAELAYERVKKIQTRNSIKDSISNNINTGNSKMNDAGRNRNSRRSMKGTNSKKIGGFDERMEQLNDTSMDVSHSGKSQYNKGYGTDNDEASSDAFYSSEGSVGSVGFYSDGNRDDNEDSSIDSIPENSVVASNSQAGQHAPQSENYSITANSNTNSRSNTETDRLLDNDDTNYCSTQSTAQQRLERRRRRRRKWRKMASNAAASAAKTAQGIVLTPTLIIKSMIVDPVSKLDWKTLYESYTIDTTKHHDFYMVTVSRLFYYCGMSVQTFFLYFVHDRIRVYDHPDKVVATMAILGQCSGAFTCYPVGVISDKYFQGRRKPFVYLACMVLGLTTLSMIKVDQLRSVEIASLVLGAANGVYLAMDTSLAVDTLPTGDVDDKDDTGSAQLLGIWGVAAFLGSAIGPLINGPLLYIFGKASGADPNNLEDYTLRGYAVVLSVSAFYFVMSAFFLQSVQSRNDRERDANSL